MKKQHLLLAAFASFYFVSCQKEDISSLEENRNLVVSANGQLESNMNEAGVPFKGSYNTSFVLLQGPPNIIQIVSGEGVASHLGKSTFEAHTSVTINPQPPFTVNGTRTITAANGDKIFTTFTGSSMPVINNMNGADLQETITGGTGRFENASGNFITKARNNFTTLSYKADFEGYIKY